MCDGIVEASQKLDFLNCPVVGRPCCVGLSGQCIVTTHEHCDFLNGEFNGNASSCSQVDCLAQACKMTPFYEDHPNQIYRIFTSIFLHDRLARQFRSNIWRIV
ncbi:Inactive rhomboid protein 1 [Cichlidogyrus casuarinus]|uniref:Inactive rhomboid protein 1 n=1 Tax=Cichlidogyrus casuarinus TaxID=1844966 RepID=A0ABD2QBE3_9PLAT